MTYQLPTTKAPPCVELMKMSAQLSSRRACPRLGWDPREYDAQADALSDDVLDGFALQTRLRVNWGATRWEVVDAASSRLARGLRDGRGEGPIFFCYIATTPLHYNPCRCRLLFFPATPTAVRGSFLFLRVLCTDVRNSSHLVTFIAVMVCKARARFS